MKKLKKYNKEELKTLAKEYNDIVKERMQTNKESMPYRVAEAMVDQNYVRPYIQLWCNETKSGELEKLYLDWSGELEKLYLDWSGELAKVDADTCIAGYKVTIKGKCLTLTYDDKYELIDVSGDCIGDITDTINGNVHGDIGGEVYGDVEGKVFGSINGFG